MTSQSGKPSDLDPMTFARYLSGEADADESARVERWIGANPEHRALAGALQAAWSRPAVPVFDPEDQVWHRIQSQIGNLGERPVLRMERDAARPSTILGVHRGRRPWLTAAAVLTLLAGGALFVRHTGLSSGVETENVAVIRREIATRRGERLALRLPDGTRVVLAAGSRLRVAEGLSAEGRGPREVDLEGEAFFNVVHDSTRPFRVRTSATIAEDLGTEFVVTHYPETGGTRVVVVSGIVALHRPDQRDAEPALATLRPGDLGAMSADRGILLERGVAVRRYVAWTEGTLVFDGTPLREVIPALSRWYDIDLRLDSAIAEQKVTATFRDEPISQVLGLLSMSLGLITEQREGVVMLRAPKGQDLPR